MKRIKPQKPKIKKRVSPNVYRVRLVVGGRVGRGNCIGLVDFSPPRHGRRRRRRFRPIFYPRRTKRGPLSVAGHLRTRSRRTDERARRYLFTTTAAVGLLVIDRLPRNSNFLLETGKKFVENEEKQSDWGSNANWTV